MSDVTTAADNSSAAYTRIGEASGPAAITLQLGETVIEAQGLAYAEFTR